MNETLERKIRLTMEVMTFGELPIGASFLAPKLAGGKSQVVPEYWILTKVQGFLGQALNNHFAMFVPIELDEIVILLA